MDYVIYTLLKDVLGKSKIDPALIEDVCLGNVSPSSMMQLNGVTNVYLRSATAKPPTSSARRPSRPESPTQQADPP